MKKLRVLIAEDHEISRALVVTLVSSECHVVGDVADWEQLVEAARRLKPDVIVSDIMMPVMDGFSARGELTSLGLHIPFVFVTVMRIDELLSGAAVAGVGYVHKSDLVGELILAIREVSRNQSYVSRSFRRDPD